MLRSSLKPLTKDVNLWLKKAEIAGDLRAENLTLEDFARLVRELDNLTPTKVIKDHF
jgi:16S rRNA A1518/A1519 N6-dimethyltransferase RsmA/KsgA/DIM1 with predicted DNA glycosylase/AP lyase activity